MRRPRCLLVVASALVVGGACGQDGPSFGAPRGATEQGRDIFRLWQGSVWAALFVGAFVWGLILFAILRFRRRGDELPTQTHANIPLEIAYTVAPLVIVAVLFAVTVGTQERVDGLVGEPAVTVEVTGFQWQWRFVYAGEDVEVVGTPDDDPVLVVPVGRTVRLDLRSTDVVHSFYVPAFLFKRDTVPGVKNLVDLKVEKPGRYDGQCAEYCGLFHDRMDFVVEAVSPEQFERWLAGQRTTATTSPVAQP